MTMTAKNAKALVSTYIKTECAHHVNCIEEIISEQASKGYISTYYAGSITNNDIRIKEAIRDELQEAGYEIHWCETRLHISWKNA